MTPSPLELRRVFATVDKVIEVGQDPRRFAEDLLRRLRDLIILAAVPEAATNGLLDVAADQAQRLQTQVAGMGAGELTRAAEVIATGLTEMRGTTAPRLHLELMCARVLLPGADMDERGLHARMDRLERRVGMIGKGEADPVPDWEDVGEPTQRIAPPRQPAPATTPPATHASAAKPAEAPKQAEAEARPAPQQRRAAGEPPRKPGVAPQPAAESAAPPTEPGPPRLRPSLRVASN